MTQTTLEGKTTVVNTPVLFAKRDLSSITLEEWKKNHSIRHYYQPEEFKPSTRLNFCHCIGCGKESEYDIEGMWGLCSVHWQEFTELWKQEMGL